MARIDCGKGRGQDALQDLQRQRFGGTFYLLDTDLHGRQLVQQPNALLEAQQCCCTGCQSGFCPQDRVLKLESFSLTPEFCA